MGQITESDELGYSSSNDIYFEYFQNENDTKHPSEKCGNSQSM